jgi:RNA-directed DNA polymerase
MRSRVADRGVVPLMAAKATSRPEGRPRLEGISGEEARDRTQSRTILPANLARVNEAAKRSRQARFTALLHHVDVGALERAFRRLRRKAAPGVDGMTVEAYEHDLEMNLRDLCGRVRSGRYRPLPVRRTYIPKADGSQRPLGILALEDKIVQGAVAEVLSAIYEADFLDGSFGFRPGRSAHQALRTVREAITTEPVNWVLDADIRKFFDSVDHDWLMRMIAHRIADPRILRLIRQWLRAGILEDGVYADTVEGTPQGAGISPLLANIVLHYVLDLWVAQWKRRHATGHVRLVRYADDYLLMFQRRQDAEMMTAALAERLAKFGLRLHEDKTRLIEFGRFAKENRRRKGRERPEVFDFLGFTHFCGKTRDGRFLLCQKTQRKRMIRKLKELRLAMRRRMHHRFRDQHAWLCSVLRGHYAYFGIPGNSTDLGRFRLQVMKAWRRALLRRSQRPKLSWERFNAILRVLPLPFARIHGWRHQMA